MMGKFFGRGDNAGKEGFWSLSKKKAFVMLNL